MAISKQAQDTWKRLGSWYGADTIERKYGLRVPDDWCEVIDRLDRDTLAMVLAETRMKFATWMPGLGEFEQIVREVRKPAPLQGPSLQEQLTDYVLKNYTLTTEQLRLPWRWLHTGNRFNGEGFTITGVDIPADGDVTGYRVMVSQMQMAAA